jgi:hypothetical protein
MRVLVACEHSGRVRQAFRARGHDAWSCDLLWPEDRSPYHFTGSILDHDIVKQDWDLMVAHPDCTFLTVSANRWAGEEWRIEARLAAMHFVRSLWAFPVPRIAIENPIGVLNTFWRQPDQTVQPWQFGHTATKATCLWLKGLPPLEPTDVVGPPPKNMTLEEKRIWNEVHRATPGPDRWRLRSLTYQGIADAMAEQWGEHEQQGSDRAVAAATESLVESVA